MSIILSNDFKGRCIAALVIRRPIHDKAANQLITKIETAENHNLA
jgi:hypothetical protein